MSATLWIVGWALGALATTRLTFRFWIDVACDGRRDPDWSEVFMYLPLSALLSAMIWPLVWLLAAARATIGGGDPGTFARRVGGEPRGARIKRLEREARERELRIARMERDLLDRAGELRLR